MDRAFGSALSDCCFLFNHYLLKTKLCEIKKKQRYYKDSSHVFYIIAELPCVLVVR